MTHIFSDKEEISAMCWFNVSFNTFLSRNKICTNNVTSRLIWCNFKNKWNSFWVTFDKMHIMIAYEIWTNWEGNSQHISNKITLIIFQEISCIAIYIKYNNSCWRHICLIIFFFSLCRVVYIMLSYQQFLFS